MSYKEKVQDKIEGFAGSEERTKLWEEICSAYERGGVEQIESRLTEEMETLKSSFEEVIQELQQML